jgi:fatty aldehyde-generating acyl-ACP reductase
MPVTRAMPDSMVLALLKRQRPYVVSRIRHVRSRLGTEVEGCFIACPLLPRQMLDMEPAVVTDRIIAAARLAERLGARIVGLGGYTSVVGDKGLTVARNLDIAVTSGNSLTAWAAIEAIRRAAAAHDLDIAGERLAVIGATGSIGSLCSRRLAPLVAGTTIVARHRDRLDLLADALGASGAPDVRVSLDPHAAIARSRLVITTTSAPDALFDIADLVPGSVVVDVSVPKNVSVQDNPRTDVVIIGGGRVRPGTPPEFSLDLGLPRGIVYSCMAETMLLSLDGRFEDFSLGDRIDPPKVDEIGAAADRHGFELVLDHTRQV